MTLLLDEIRGVQVPRVRLRPAGAVASSGPEAVELAARCGLVLDDWQALVLDDAMAERVDGSWAASDVGLIASRQNGKNGVVEARELFGVTILGEWIIHTAHLFKTTRESYGRLLSLVEGHVDVRRCLVSAVASPASGYEMRFASGGRITFIARSRSSGRGLTGDMLVLDEAQDLGDDALGALLPTISAAPLGCPQTWYLGSAPGFDSTVFHRVRKRGRAGVEHRLAFAEFSADPDADLDDPEAWAQANPAGGDRLGWETVAAERTALSPEIFAQERLSISPDPPEDSGVFPGASWSECCDPAVQATASVFAIDVNPERSAAGIVVAGDGPVVEVVEYRPGTGWLVDRCVELHETHGVGVALDKRGPAGSFAAELDRRGVPVVELDSTEMTRACGLFYDLVTNRGVRVRQHADLDRAVACAAQRTVGDGAWAWGRKSSSDDIALLVAATVGVWVATSGDAGDVLAMVLGGNE